jgi:hypothetical protein
MADDDRKIDFLGMLTEPRRPATGRATPPAQTGQAETEDTPPAKRSRPARPKKAAKTSGAPASKPKKTSAPPNRGNYLGNGLYLHKGGEKRKMTSYIDPAIHREVKVAGAAGDDPRGSDMSEIVENALRAYGFGGAEEA